LFIEVFHRADGRFVPNVDLNAQVYHAFIKFSDAGNVDSRIFNFFSCLNLYHEFGETSSSSDGPLHASGRNDGYADPKPRSDYSTVGAVNSNPYYAELNETGESAYVKERLDGYSNPSSMHTSVNHYFSVGDATHAYNAANADGFYSFPNSDFSDGYQIL
jgi:hypothetical protein